VKKIISIICLVALFLSTSSLAYFYWLQEHIHETKVFSQIKDGTFKEDDVCHSLVSLEVKDKNVLPEGYEWEEEGREFTYKGMLYDIVAMEQTKEGWIIKAASDEEEVIMVSNKTKFQKDREAGTAKSTTHGLKLNIAKIVFDHNITEFSISLDQNKCSQNSIYLQSHYKVFLYKQSPPPKIVLS